MLLDFRKPKCIVQDSCVSDSGKYYCFYGNHWHNAQVCYVVGASNRSNGEIIMRHYNKHNNPDERTAKSMAKEYWQHVKSKMQEKEKENLEDDINQSILKHLKDPRSGKPN